MDVLAIPKDHTHIHQGTAQAGPRCEVRGHLSALVGDTKEPLRCTYHFMCHCTHWTLNITLSPCVIYHAHPCTFASHFVTLCDNLCIICFLLESTRLCMICSLYMFETKICDPKQLTFLVHFVHSGTIFLSTFY